jgi:hypothetical protein
VNKTGSTLLGDSENPAHTEWLEKATKLKEKYDWGPWTVRFVRSALQKVVGQLLFVPEGRDEQLLKNIFYLEEPADGGPDSASRKGKSKTDDDVDVNPPPPKLSPIVIKRIKGGFCVARHSPESPLPKEVAVEVAYELRRGNAFKKYERFDFQLQKKPIQIVAQSADVQPEDNLLRIKPTGEDFLIEVTGFDPHRDLAVRAVPKWVELADASEI